MKSLINYLNESEIDTKYIQTDNVLETSKVLVFIDENKNEIQIFSENNLFKNWNLDKKKFHLLNS